jgi:hypothetical protein
VGGGVRPVSPAGVRPTLVGVVRVAPARVSPAQIGPSGVGMVPADPGVALLCRSRTVGVVLAGGPMTAVVGVAGNLIVVGAGLAAAGLRDGMPSVVAAVGVAALEHPGVQRAFGHCCPPARFGPVARPVDMADAVVRPVRAPGRDVALTVVAEVQPVVMGRIGAAFAPFVAEQPIGPGHPVVRGLRPGRSRIAVSGTALSRIIAVAVRPVAAPAPTTLPGAGLGVPVRPVVGRAGAGPGVGVRPVVGRAGAVPAVGVRTAGQAVTVLPVTGPAVVVVTAGLVIIGSGGTAAAGLVIAGGTVVAGRGVVAGNGRNTGAGQHPRPG